MLHAQARTPQLTLAGEEEEKEETPSLPLPCHDPDVREAEGRLPKLYAHEAIEVPGARTLLEELNRDSAPWTIVTSGTEPLVTGWLGVMALPHPDQMVTAESVENGKPDPACYLLGRQRLGLEGDAKRVLVLEDAPAGIRAGKAAGCKVIGLVTSHTVDQVAAAEPDWIHASPSMVTNPPRICRPAGHDSVPYAGVAENLYAFLRRRLGDRDPDSGLVPR
ncbi:Glycerol-1-phosphate phosphohydrolase 1 like protein [Verticillium longisporum]|nr:Glycerol-1-phosphate phosphohydrolase 1 like protein [Verticillium longisporum]